MKRLNNKQIEESASAVSNLGNILFLGLAVTSLAVAGLSKVQISTWVLSLFGWLFCHVVAVWILSFWRREDGTD
jgi:Na+/glutamate symporter